ncbi:MAG: cytochrome c oxidase subunit 4 [Actinomycetales bacterium]
MRVEYWVFFIIGLFYIPVTLVYAAMGGEPVGIAALTLSAGLGLMIAAYLRLASRKLPNLPEENPNATVAEYPGEQGEFSPWSWWPLPLAACASLIFFGFAVGYWVSAIGVVLGAVALIGWVYEYYRGAHAH